MNSERLAKYEGWVRELEARQKNLANTRARYSRLFVGLAVVSPFGFVWGPRFGLGALFTGLVMCAYGFYTVVVREQQYVREIAQTRSDIEDLRDS